MLTRVYLSVNEDVIKQDEPVTGEAAGVLRSQGSVAAFTHHTPLRETQALLRNTHERVLLKVYM